MSIANYVAPSNLKETDNDSQGNFQAAVARTAARSLALYFSRPVRLFKPTKVSGWHLMRNLAARNGESVNPQFMRGLVSTHGLGVIPKHFLPPIIVNAALGTILWTTYSETSTFLEPHLGHHLTTQAAISGAVAGVAQALAAAPAENVRLLMEGSTGYNSWSHAWKEVFRGTEHRQKGKGKRDQARQVHHWMKDVKGMAGRGWDGWTWGCAKDMVGFSVFFALFEVTRRVSLRATTYAAALEMAREKDRISISVERQFPKVVHGLTLVAGGVLAGLAYEFLGRPFDAVRRLVATKGVQKPANLTAIQIVRQKIEKRGLRYFFRDPSTTVDTGGVQSPLRRRALVALRTLGRVGPWGIGFLVWEAYGSGLYPA